jgi:hypothetical protein
MKKPEQTHRTMGLNTASSMALLITAGVIWSAISPWWLIAAAPLFIVGLGLEVHEQQTRQIQL